MSLSFLFLPHKIFKQETLLILASDIICLWNLKAFFFPLLSTLLSFLSHLLFFIFMNLGLSQTVILLGANWCVCKDGSDAILQKTLDYACGAGADCNPIHQNAPCFNPNTVRAHCNYAVNSYFQKKGQAQGSCEFAGTATVTASDPSNNSSNLSFPFLPFYVQMYVCFLNIN